MRHLGVRLKRFRRSQTSAFREHLIRLAPQAEAPPKSRRVARTRLWSVLKYVAAVLACLAAAPFTLIVVYRFVDPPTSALMAMQALKGTKISHAWRPLEQLSPELAAAVIVSEDAQFCKHWGVDWNAIGEAWSVAEDGGKLRGASTIPMQTVKNLFFWPGRSYVRKVAETPLAYFMSLVWTKDRVIEVYLNIAEWGPGVFGAEAAAQHHFHKSAAQLNGFESAALAASLPNPILRNAGKPGPQTFRLIGRLRKRVAVERAQARCVTIAASQAPFQGAAKEAPIGAVARAPAARKPPASRNDRRDPGPADRDPYWPPDGSSSWNPESWGPDGGRYGRDDKPGGGWR